MVKKILIAEDDPDILFMLHSVLDDAGYKVESMPDGSSIMARGDNWPDLFILDDARAVIDGLALSKYLKTKDDTKDIPIIMISAYHNLKQKARKIGVEDFLEKPFELKTLLQTINKYNKVSES